MNGTIEPSKENNEKSTSDLTMMSMGIDKEKGKAKMKVIQYAGEPVYDYIQQQILDGMVMEESFLGEDGKVRDIHGNIVKEFPPKSYKKVESNQTKRCKLQDKPIPPKVNIGEKKLATKVETEHEK